MPKIHELKIQRGYFAQVMNNQKTADVRLDDGHDFRVGDQLLLKEYDSQKRIFSGAAIRKKIVGMTRLSDVIRNFPDPRWVVLYMGDP